LEFRIPALGDIFRITCPIAIYLTLNTTKSSCRNKSRFTYIT